MSEDVAASEIIIVRRRGHGHDDGHGSTAWKIAFADFMTAMMALFLVLWLTNATDMATKKQIATYFNPIELTDIKPLEKGIRTVDAEVVVDKEAVNDKPDGRTNSSGEAPGTLDGGPEKVNRPLFSDPYDVIRKLSADTSAMGTGEGTQDQKNGGGPAMEKGEAFRDPFDPLFRSETLAMANSSAEAPSSSKVVEQDSETNLEDLKKDSEHIANASQSKASTASQEAAYEGRRLPNSQLGEAIEQEAEALAKELNHALGGFAKSKLPNVEVAVVPEGILVSLTDKSNFEMFATASAEASAGMSELMQKVGKIIRSTDGSIIVRGHTDGRPFRTTDNDNWRLSMARAYTAYSALMRAGIDEQRFEHIEGHADRMLRNKNDPNAAMNRRIEVLLRKKVR